MRRILFRSLAYTCSGSVAGLAEKTIISADGAIEIYEQERLVRHGQLSDDQMVRLQLLVAGLEGVPLPRLLTRAVWSA